MGLFPVGESEPSSETAKAIHAVARSARSGLSDRGRWSEGYALGIFHLSGTPKGAGGCQHCHIASRTLKVSVIVTICCPQTAGSLVLGDQARGPCGWLRSRALGVSETAQVMLQDPMGALGAAVHPTEVSFSLPLPQPALWESSSGLLWWAQQGAAVLGSAPSAGSRACRSSFLRPGEEKACYLGFARRGCSILRLNLYVLLL